MFTSTGSSVDTWRRNRSPRALPYRPQGVTKFSFMVSEKRKVLGVGYWMVRAL